MHQPLVCVLGGLLETAHALLEDTAGFCVVAVGQGETEHSPREAAGLRQDRPPPWRLRPRTAGRDCLRFFPFTWRAASLSPSVCVTNSLAPGTFWNSRGAPPCRRITYKTQFRSSTC